MLKKITNDGVLIVFNSNLQFFMIKWCFNGIFQQDNLED